MAGRKEGGIAAAITNKSRYGPNFYAKIGAIGGSIGHTGGFYQNRELARVAGRVGGLKSRRGQRFKTPLDQRKFDQAYKHLLKIKTKADKQRETGELDLFMPPESEVLY